MKNFKLYTFTLICLFLSVFSLQANTVSNGNGNNDQSVTQSDDCFSLFPNPATTYVNVRLDNSLSDAEEVITIIILDSSGRIVEEMILERYQALGELDLIGLSAGDYVVKLMVGDNCCQMKKLLISE